MATCIYGPNNIVNEEVSYNYNDKKVGGRGQGVSLKLMHVQYVDSMSEFLEMVTKRLHPP